MTQQFFTRSRGQRIYCHDDNGTLLPFERKCDAIGYIAYRNGSAWSVKIVNGDIVEWRYNLDWYNRNQENRYTFGPRTSNQCAECERHILAADAELYGNCSKCAQLEDLLDELNDHLDKTRDVVQQFKRLQLYIEKLISTSTDVNRALDNYKKGGKRSE